MGPLSLGFASKPLPFICLSLWQFVLVLCKHIKNILLQAGGGGGGRPISGAFTLDLEKIEAGMERVSDSGPQLVQHDLDDILNDSPVVLPVTRTAVNRPASPDSASRLLNNQEAHQAVNAVIAQIFSQDTQTSISALAQVRTTVVLSIVG